MGHLLNMRNKMRPLERTAQAALLGLFFGLAPQSGLAQEGEIIGDEQQYDNGAIYRGQFRNGLQHGTGTYTLPNGYEYTGQWVDGQIMGEGRATFPDGSVYEGAFVAGKPNGQGTITFVDGST